MLGLLTKKQRTAWQLYKFEGRTQSEIAIAMKRTRESVNRLIARARQRLQKFRDTCAERGSCVILEQLAA